MTKYRMRYIPYEGGSDEQTIEFDAKDDGAASDIAVFHEEGMVQRLDRLNEAGEPEAMIIPSPD